MRRLLDDLLDTSRISRGVLELQREPLDLRSVIEAAIDATAGNGHDTHFLSEHVGPAGEVYAIDLQKSALEVTSRRLSAIGLQNVRLINQDHAQLSSLVPIELRSRIGAIMFNLGYLPGGDKSITTSPTST